MRHAGRIALFCFAAAGLLFATQAHCGDLSRDAAHNLHVARAAR